MHKRRNMLETIYEADEHLIPDEFDDDLASMTEQPSRLSYYICWCMITGCFFTLTIIIAISLNPFLLSKTPMNKSSYNILNISVNSDDKLILSTNIIKHLDIFSHQINEQLNLQPNTITFFTSTVSDLSVENQNQILWIYSDLKYPRICFDNNQCKKKFNLKLKTSFTRLSHFLTTTELESYPNRQIQLDWCNLTEYSTRAILVSLVSISTINQTAAEATTFVDRRICTENIDQTIVLSAPIDNIIRNDNQQLTNTINFNHNRFKTKKETNSRDCSKYNQRKETTRCPNDIDTQILLMWNSF